MNDVSLIDGHMETPRREFSNSSKVINDFLKLVTENPTLPVIPMVDNEVVGDSWGRWMGLFGYSYISEYALYEENYYDDRESFKEAYYDNNCDELEERFGYKPMINEYTVRNGNYTQEELEANENAEKMLEAYLDSVAEEYFADAIIVNIETL